MVALLDRLPLCGMAIGSAVLLSGTATAVVVEDGVLPALVAAIVLLVIDDQTQSEE